MEPTHDKTDSVVESSSAEAATRDDVRVETNQDYYYQLSHQDIVTEIYPTNFLHCHISIGNVEVLIHPMKLPFRSPSILNCKLKITYANKIESPHLLIQDVYRKHYKVSALQDVTLQSSYVSDSPISRGSRGFSSGPSPTLIMALTQRAQDAQPPMRQSIQPPHRTLKRKSPDVGSMEPPTKNDADSKRSTCCMLWG